MTPRFVAVIPTLNEEATLGRAIASLRGQDVDCAVVVVDGGSTDGTPEAASRYADASVSIGRGLGRARNVGASLAGPGSILVFMDADTELPPGALRRMRDLFKPGVAAVTMGASPSRGTALNRVIWGVINALSGLSIRLGYPVVPGYLIAVRWEAWSRTRFSEALSAGEDIDFSVRLRRCGSVARVGGLRAVTSSRRVDARGLRSVADYVSTAALCLLGRQVEYRAVR